MKYIKIFLFISVISFSFAYSSIYDAKSFFVIGVANTASLSKKNALDKGLQEAFKNMLLRITPPSYESKIEEIATKENANAYFRQYAINNEVIENNKYTAYIDYNFNSSNIIKLLHDSQISIVTKIGKPVLVIPITYKEETSEFVYEENLYSKVLKLESKNANLIPIKVPDIDTEINVELLRANNTRAMNKLKEEFNVEKIYVMEFTKQDNTLNTVLKYEKNEVQKNSLYIELSEELVVNNIINRTILEISRDFREENDDGSAIKTIPVHIYMPKITNWNKAYTKLESVSIIDSVSVVEITSKYILVNISYVGSYDQLSQAVSSLGFIVGKSFGGYAFKCVSCN